MIKTASTRLHLLRILKNYVSKQQLILIYISTIQSIFDYSYPIHNLLSASMINKIGIVRNRGHKIICGPQCKSSCLPDYTERCNALAHSLFKKALLDPNHIINSLLPKISSHSNRLILPIINKDNYLRSYIPHQTQVYNRTIQP